MNEIKDYLQYFFINFEFPEDARETLLRGFEKIAVSKKGTEIFKDALQDYDRDRYYSYSALLSHVLEILNYIEIDEYALKLLFNIALTKILRGYYLKENISLEIWRDSVKDIKYKLMECKAVYGKWGTFAKDWFRCLFDMTRFGFGILQFHQTKFNSEYNHNGITLTSDSIVISVHIPRTGKPLAREDVASAYGRARRFFTDRIGSPVIFVCRSWLLFPKLRQVLSPQSNLLAFAKDYDVFDYGEYADYEETWRIFDKRFTPELETLPQKTSLQRVVLEWIKEGEKFGWGYGVYRHEN